MRRLAQAALGIATVVVAARLFVPAVVLAFSGAGTSEFNATGLPHWMRMALALPEILGAVLIVIPRTFYVGVILLVFDLVGAIAVHLSLGVRPVSLYVLLAALLMLALARRHLLS